MATTFSGIRLCAAALLCLVARALEPTAVKTLYYLAENSTTHATPFQLQIDASDADSAPVRLHVTCSEDVSIGVRLVSAGVSVCMTPDYTAQPNEINAYLSALSAHPTDLSKSNFWVNYQVLNADNATIFSISQTFSLLSKIPINQLTRSIHLKRDDARTAVLSIDQTYRDSFGLEGIRVETPTDAGVSFQLEENILYVKCSKGAFKELPKTLYFSLADSNTGLRYNDLHIKLGAETAAEKSAPSKSLFVAVLGAFVAIVAIVALLCLGVMRRRGNINMANSIQAKALASLPTDQNQTQEKTVVLTESIVTWNKRLLDRHKKKQNQDAHEDTNIVILGRERSKKNEVAAEKPTRGEDYPHENSRRYRPFDDISVINTESMDLKSPVESGNMSFLDDLNF